MLIDTHCHLDAAEFDADRPEVAAHALRAGVTAIVIPAVERANFGVVRDLARRTAGGAYALGIHPLYVERAGEGDLQALREAVQQALDDPRFVAIGEIGLDFFVPEIAAGAPRERQEHFYAAQLALAAESACRCCCMCASPRTSCSSTCAVMAASAASPMPSTAARNRRKPSSTWASRWAWAGP